MQFVVVTIRTSEQKPMIYPAVYRANAVERHRVGPIVYDGGIQRGGPTAECLMAVDNAFSDVLAADPDIRKLTRAEADTWLADNPKVAEKPVEQVNDDLRLAMIRTKIAAGIALSQEDNDALDPTSSVRGITRRTRDVDGYFPDFR